jgi:tetratricopeptide (TPR) repeat protein
MQLRIWIGGLGLLLLTGIGMMMYAVLAPAHLARAQPDRPRLLALLREERFDHLEATFDARRRAVERGELRDIELHWDFSTFQNSDLALSAPLQSWVEKRPASAIAHAARAHYYLHLGWLAVKSGGSRETRAAQAMRRNNNFVHAKSEFEAALRADPKMMTAIAGLMQIGMWADRRAVIALYEQGRSIDPLSPTLHWQYLHALQPQWGGDFAVMRRHLRDLRTAAPDNRFDDLQGLFDYFMALHARAAGDREAALAHYDRSLSAATHADVLFDRGFLKIALKDLDGARRDIEQALALRPHKALYLYGVAHLEQALLNFPKAHEAYTQALALDGGNPDYLEERAYLALRLGRNVEAVRDMDAAQRLGDLNQRLQRSMTQFYIMADQAKKSLEPAKRAVSLDPKGSRNWLWMAEAHYANQDCQAHAAYARFLELCPQDGQCAATQGLALPEVIRYFRCDGVPFK